MFIQADVHGIGIAEQIVQVAEDLLVRAQQKCTQNVRAVVERMQRQASSSRPAGR